MFILNDEFGINFEVNVKLNDSDEFPHLYLLSTSHFEKLNVKFRKVDPSVT